ncbi:MAG: preprotein translocase subunit SecG [Desulfohalobiaceae bacterium]
MGNLILTIHIIACISLVLLVLMQSGHQGMGVIFGGSSSSLFGSSGAGGILTKLTVVMAIIFFVTSLSFAYFHADYSGSKPISIMEEAQPEAGQGQETPAATDEEQESPAAEEEQ